MNDSELIKYLDHKDINICRLAVYALGAMGDVTAVQPLINILKNKDKNMYLRYSAAKSLGRIGKPAVLPLIELLKDTNSDVLNWIVWALGQTKDDRAVIPLINLLKDESHDVIRASIASALGEIGSQRALYPLIRLVKNNHKNMYIRYSAAVALGRLRTIAAGILPQLLKDEDSHVRNLAALVLDGYRNSQTATPTKKLRPKDKLKKTPIETACDSARLGDQKALAFLIKALKNGNRLTRLDAAEALAELALEPCTVLVKGEPVIGSGLVHKSTIPFLITALKDDYIGVRAKAVTALGNIGDKSALIKAIEIMQKQTL